LRNKLAYGLPLLLQSLRWSHRRLQQDRIAWWSFDPRYFRYC
jgi:hypothetical protein